MNLGSLVGYLGLDTGDFDKGLDSAESSLGRFAKRAAVAAAAAGIAIAGALGAAVAGAMNVEAGTDKVAAQLNLTGPDAERAGRLAGELYSGAYVGSLEEGGQLVRSIAQNIGTDLNDVDFSEIAAKVADLGNGFDQDLGATTRAVGQLMRTGMATDATEALDIVTAGFQSGIDASGDFLDVLTEYGGSFRTAGMDAAAATGLMVQGLQAGARSADEVADAVREVGIRITDATASEAITDLGLNFSDVQRRFAEGGPAAAGALDQVMDRLRAVENPARRAALAIELGGSMAENMGEAFTALDPSEAAAGLGELEGRAASFGDTLNDNASTALQSFKNQAQMAFFGLANGLLPVVNQVTSALATGFGPALSTVRDIVANQVVPALQAAARWVGENKGPVTVVAGLIGAVFVPHLIALGVAATVNAAKVVAGFVMTQAGAVAAAAVHSAQVARMVAGWVLMGAQSLVQAARMAAAWFIALGPIGWVTAAVIGLVALVIANWDKVKTWTVNAWNAVTEKVSGAWRSIKDAVSNGVTSAVNFMRELPGRAVSALGNIGSLLLGAGADLIRGFVNGIKNMASTVANAAKDVAKSAVNGVKNFLGINSPSKVFAELGTNVGEGFVKGIAGMRPAVAAEMARMADTQALAGLRVPTFAAAPVGGQPGGMAGPGAASPGAVGLGAAAAGGGPLVAIEHWHEESKSPDRLANEMAVMLRTSGGPG